MQKTYLFYDIETTGLNKCFDQVIQFAAIRTDLQLNEIERHEFYIKLNKDVVPSPRAFITHRISLASLTSGLSEFEAMAKIHALLNTPGTISLGYNTLGFDDEFLRFSFYRNLLTPYTHQYANHCSRMDLYPMTVMCSLFKRELLSWPENTLKLENIGRQNGFLEGAAHNAITDVIATVKLAKCLQQDKKTWDYLCGFFDKQTDLDRCTNIISEGNLPLGIYVDGKLGAEQQYQTMVTPLGIHQHYKNKTLWLRLDLSELNEATSDNFVEKTWVINKKLGESGLVLPMKERFLQPYLQTRQQEILDAKLRLESNTELFEKISDYYRNYTYPKINNLDTAAKLYDNNFLSYHDQDICKKFHAAAANKKESTIDRFSVEDLKELAIRTLGHYDSELLSTSLRDRYDAHCSSVMSAKNETLDYTGKKRLTPQEALDDIAELELTSLDGEQQCLLRELKEYLTTRTVLS